MISLSMLLACGPKLPPVPEGGSPQVLLDGVRLEVRWDDGDTFSWYDAAGEKQKARLNGFNTLESYGPVHRWGDWLGAELYALAKFSGEVAGSRVWNCTDTGSGGGYGRKLVDCPELRAHLLSQGYAHAFSIDGPAPDEDIENQATAIKKGRGMWEKGAPEGLLTSLHSADERDDESAYNRVCSLTTGLCDKVTHDETYAACQEVSMQGSYMLYVPYKQRYGEGRADCLR
jgi:micrococcal nuclease